MKAGNSSHGGLHVSESAVPLSDPSNATPLAFIALQMHIICLTHVKYNIYTRFTLSPFWFMHLVTALQHHLSCKGGHKSNENVNTIKSRSFAQPESGVFEGRVTALCW